LFDTADVYGDGRSESIIGRFLAERPGHGITVATKMGRRLDQLPENYSPQHFREWTTRSRQNLRVDTLDLVQLHCPPSAVIEADETYAALDELVAEGVMAAYGVSVETCAQALAAISRPHVTNVQIILNPFRLKPLDEVLPAAEAAGVAIFARVPLASGLLSGRYDASTTFAADDHRTYNRHGEAFDVGETFSGVDYATGVRAAREFADLIDAVGPTGLSPAEVALAWVWQQPGVTTVIPGARNTEQARSNAAAGGVGALPDDLVAAIADLYDRRIREQVHGRW
jgi:aryl-alcohol dehydrogenase-like predicted oxidoreductase